MNNWIVFALAVFGILMGTISYYIYGDMLEILRGVLWESA